MNEASFVALRGFHIIKRKLHRRLEILNLSSSVEKYLARSLRSLENYFFYTCLGSVTTHITLLRQHLSQDYHWISNWISKNSKLLTSFPQCSSSSFFCGQKFHLSRRNFILVICGIKGMKVLIINTYGAKLKEKSGSN